MKLERDGGGPAEQGPRLFSLGRGNGSAQQDHETKVQRIRDQLRSRPRDRPLRLRKKAVSHQVPKAVRRGAGDGQIDVSDLTAILDIDPAARTCVAESGVTFVDLVAATLPHGLVPLVVPELKTITVGGAVAGCSIESMSFRYGGFHDTCLEYEVITASGDVVTCGPGRNELLFQMMHGTFGTLGILSKLKFRLVPAKPFVHVSYRNHPSLAAFQTDIARHFDAQDVDFMDGIIHGPTDWVLCTGRFVDEAPYSNRYDWMKVYYRSTRQRGEDFLRTHDYLFRYDRGVTNVHPKSWLGRLLLGKIIDSSRLLRMAEWFHRLLPANSPPVTLDVFIPFSRVPQFLDWLQRRFNHFPLWCVPYRRVRDYEWLSPEFYRGLEDKLFLDIAIYGMEQRAGENAYREIEEELARVGGLKTLISHNFYSQEQFWKIWNKPNYQKVKAHTDPENVFRDLYDKTVGINH